MQPMDAQTKGLASGSSRSAHVVLEIGDWFLWNWNSDPAEGDWLAPFGIFHRCGIENAEALAETDADPASQLAESDAQATRVGHYTETVLSYSFKCRRCVESPPDGLVAVYELLNWEANGYGG